MSTSNTLTKNDLEAVIGKLVSNRDDEIQELLAKFAKLGETYQRKYFLKENIPALAAGAVTTITYSNLELEECEPVAIVQFVKSGSGSGHVVFTSWNVNSAAKTATITLKNTNTAATGTLSLGITVLFKVL